MTDYKKELNAIFKKQTFAFSKEWVPMSTYMDIDVKYKGHALVFALVEDYSTFVFTFVNEDKCWITCLWDLDTLEDNNGYNLDDYQLEFLDKIIEELK